MNVPQCNTTVNMSVSILLVVFSVVVPRVSDEDLEDNVWVREITVSVL